MSLIKRFLSYLRLKIIIHCGIDQQFLACSRRSVLNYKLSPVTFLRLMTHWPVWWVLSRRKYLNSNQCLTPWNVLKHCQSKFCCQEFCVSCLMTKILIKKWYLTWKMTLSNLKLKIKHSKITSSLPVKTIHIEFLTHQYKPLVWLSLLEVPVSSGI